MNIADDYISFTNCTDNENEDNNLIINYLLLSIPSSVLLLYVISLNIWTILKTVITKKSAKHSLGSFKHKNDNGEGFILISPNLLYHQRT